MNYLYLIRQLFIYNKYLKYRHHIKIEKDQKEIYYLFKALDQLMEKFQKDISFEDYALWVQVNLGNDYAQYIQLLKETNTDETILEASLNEIKTRSVLYELASAALAGSEGKKTVEDILQLVEQLTQEKEQANNDPFVSTSLSELYDDAYKHQGLRWRLSSLNQSLGSLRGGDFGFIFARPETGKTTFLADQSTYFTEQLDDTDGPGLWFNNEEQHKKVMLRCIQAALGVTMQEIAKDIRGYEEQYKRITKDKLKLPNFDTTHKREMEALCKDVKPSFIIIDQVSKVRGFNNDREDLRLGAAFEWARDLAKEFDCPVIGVNQADGSGEGKKYLDMSNVANSKTAVQAEADFILGIGKSNDQGFELIRHFNISKNKLAGDESSDPSKRHAKWDALIQPDIARFRDL